MTYPVTEILPSPSTLVLLPPRLDVDSKHNRMDAEIARVAKSADSGVVFRLFMDVGDDEDGREDFEWRKFDKRSDEQAEGNGFKLVWLSSSLFLISTPWWTGAYRRHISTI